MSLLAADTWEGRILLENWTPGAGGEQTVVESATGSTIGTVGLTTRDDVRRAAQLAASAQRQWAATPPAHIEAFTGTQWLTARSTVAPYPA